MQYLSNLLVEDIELFQFERLFFIIINNVADNIYVIVSLHPWAGVSEDEFQTVDAVVLGSHTFCGIGQLRPDDSPLLDQGLKVFPPTNMKELALPPSGRTGPRRGWVPE